jgi:N-methylhydantoinase A/oxoprolinase/acetone carboxylase beta subunit
MKLVNNYVLGIDVGGTHVDFAVVNNQQEIHAWHKEVIFDTPEKSILKGIEKLIVEQTITPSACQGIHLGTTIGVNSLLQLNSLYRVGLIRLAGHQPDLPPAYNWPQPQREAVLAGFETVSGGKEFDNQAINQLNPEELKNAVKKLIAKGAESIAIIGVFSPLYAEEEKLAEQIIANEVSSDLPVTLSHEIGGLGFIERENNVLINATLKKVMQKNFSSLQDALSKLGFSCKTFVTQNNGTLLKLDEAIQFPIKTISSGPTNSLVGACKLAGLSHAIIVDIGGTSTDIGIIENAFPRYSSAGAVIAGIPTNFMLPDIQVLALGGGSIIEEASGDYHISAKSLGPRVFNESRSCGGTYLSLFDIGKLLNKACCINGISKDTAENIMQKVCARIRFITDAIPSKLKLPVVLVGGGVQNIPEAYLDQNFFRPQFYQVANAYGAALAEVSGTIDVIHALAHNKEQTLQALEQQAIEKALNQGVDPSTVRIIEKRLLPFFYMPNQMTRIIITAAGQKTF